MTTEVKARFQVKDEDGNAVLIDGQPQWQEATCQYDFGDSLDDAVNRFGAEAVFTNFVSAGRVAVQSIMRSKMKAGMSEEAIQAFLDSYILGVPVERTVIDPLSAVKNMVANWTPEKLAAFIEELQGTNAE